MPQFKSDKASEKKKPHVYWSLIFKGLQRKNKAYIHTHSNKVYSPEQLSQESSHRASATRFILLQNHTGKPVVTASSHIRPQITERHTCFTEMGNKQQHSLTCYITATYWGCPHSNRFEDYLGQSRAKVQPDSEHLLGFWLVSFFFTNSLRDS